MPSATEMLFKLPSSQAKVQVCSWLLSASVNATVMLTELPKATGPLGPVTLVMTGAELTTVTVAWQELDPPLPSSTVSVTAVVPSEYGPAGSSVIVSGSPSGSEEPLLISAAVTSAWQLAFAEIVTFWHRATGGWLLAAHLPAEPAA